MTNTEREASREEEKPTPLGARHLHRICPNGHWMWAVRERGGAICKTTRCRRIIIDTDPDPKTPTRTWCPQCHKYVRDWPRCRKHGQLL